MVVGARGTHGSRFYQPQAAELAETLQWGDAHELKRRRDDAVHASWWNGDGVGVVRFRFFRRQDGANLIGTFEDLEQDATLLFEYAEKLDLLLRADWPQGRLLRRARDPCVSTSVREPSLRRLPAPRNPGDSPYVSDPHLQPVSELRRTRHGPVWGIVNERIGGQDCADVGLQVGPDGQQGARAKTGAHCVEVFRGETVPACGVGDDGLFQSRPCRAASSVRTDAQKPSSAASVTSGSVA
ncbi:hypothetical protein ACWEQH_20835 [Streptomyces sp. NPDC004166]